MTQELDQPRDRPALLNITSSLDGRFWRQRTPPNPHIGEQIAQRNDLPLILGNILHARGIAPDQVTNFLSPSLRNSLTDPATLRDMDKAVDRMINAILRNEQVAIFGDYDVDGATSTALLGRFLTELGIPWSRHIPDRITEGYGPNIAAITRLQQGGAQLLVCVDCGSTAIDILEEAAGNGLDIIVLDHHQTETDLPPAAVVNPNRPDDLSGLGYLAAVGVTFMFLIAVNRRLRELEFYRDRDEVNLLQWLGLVALGTICDAVPLIGVNRALVAKGLEALSAYPNLGLQSLIKLAELEPPFNAYHMGFIVGPRINAGGRIGRSDLGVDLLTTDNIGVAADVATHLDRLNNQRREMERVAIDDGMAQAEALLAQGTLTQCLILSSPAWHPGIIGLIASRIKERFRRPTITIAIDAFGVGVGSGRSVPGIDLGRVIRRAVSENLLLRGGGHAMAAGLAVAADQLEPIRRFIDAAIAADISQDSGPREADILAIDAPLSAGGAHLDFVTTLQKLEPYGTGNPEPCFVFPQHLISFADVVGADHVRCRLRSGDGTMIDAIAFRAASKPLGRRLLSRNPDPIHIAGHLRIDHWGGRKRVKLHIVDAAEVM